MKRSKPSGVKEVGQPPPLVVVFVRHGQAGGADVDQVHGPPLTPLGRRQARRVARRLAREKFAHIYTSDLARARDTARAICRHHRHTPCTVLQDLREVSHYQFVRHARPPRSISAWFLRKERAAMARFERRLRRDHRPGEQVLVVCHGNIIRTLIPRLGGYNPRQSVYISIHNASVTIAHLLPPDQAWIRVANCTKHLLPSQIT